MGDRIFHATRLWHSLNPCRTVTPVRSCYQRRGVPPVIGSCTAKEAIRSSRDTARDTANTLRECHT